MRLLFLLDSFKNVPAATETIALAQTFRAGGSEVGIVVFRPGGTLFHEAKKLGLPLRVQQFFDFRLSFYAPGLTGAVIFFRPDAVIFCSAGTLFHGGPLARAFRGLRMFSIVAFCKKPNWFARHALRRMIAIFAPDTMTEVLLKKIVPAEKIQKLSADTLANALIADNG